MRLIIPYPEPDETISSIMDRTCAFYRMTRPKLVSALAPSLAHAYPVDLDINPQKILLDGLSRALLMPIAELEARLLTRPDWRLAPSARTAYCPKCWDDDVAAGRDTYFRAAWSWCFATCCEVHDAPLETWTHTVRPLGQRKLYARQLAGTYRCPDVPELPYGPKPSRIDWTDSAVREIWLLVRRHESRVRALLGPVPRYQDARLRSLYCLVAGDWHRRQAGPPAKRYRPRGKGEALLAFRQQHQRACISESIVRSWDHFRRIADPGHRRTANWLVARVAASRPADALNSHCQESRAELKKLLLEGVHERYHGVFRRALNPRGLYHRETDQAALQCAPDSEFRTPRLQAPASRAAEAPAELGYLSRDFA